MGWKISKNIWGYKTILVKYSYLSAYGFGKANLSLYTRHVVCLGGNVVSDDENKEREIYYLSKTLIDYETRYTPMEKLCFAIVLTIEKLRHYLLYCTTYVVSLVNPLKYLVTKKIFIRKSS